jgi:ketol-acid reductoisomerase
MAVATNDNTFSSKTFAELLKVVDIAGTKETVMYGGDRKFALLKNALGGVKQISVIGWSSQGPAQAQNLRDSIKAAGLDIKVVVGLRDGSPSWKKAEAAGFKAADGTLTTVEEAIKTADMSLLLIADAAMATNGKELIGLAKSGSDICLSHGFYLGYIEAAGETIRKDINIIGVCPKGMGPSVRRLYEQGSGINASFALEQGDDAARDRALAWALALGSPYIFQTTLGMEWRSDIFGERGTLLGAVHGIVEAVYAWKVQHGVAPEKAYTDSVEAIVGPISSTISHDGLKTLVEKVTDKDRFKAAYNAAYPHLKALIEKMYLDVSSGREIQEVVSDDEHNVPMTRVDGGDMWRVGEKVRAERSYQEPAIDPDTAGIYVAAIVAQVDVLRANGHHWSEVINESIIEAVDSLNPFMKARGVDYMVDNCSITARRGSRKWAPQFRAWIDQGVLPIIDQTRPAEDDHDYFADFEKHDVHTALKVLGAMRPPIDIAVV